MEYEELELGYKAIELLGEKALACRTENEIYALRETIKLLTPAIYPNVLRIIDRYLLGRLFEIFADEADDAKAASSVDGVYVIQFENDMVKIGRTKNYPQRLAMLSQQSHSKAISNRFFPCRFASQVEATAHRYFNAERIKNEFFSTDYDLVVQFLEMATNTLPGQLSS